MKRNHRRWDPQMRIIIPWVILMSEPGTKSQEASRPSLIEWAQTWNDYAFSSEEELWKLSDLLEGWLSHKFMPRYCPFNFSTIVFLGIYYLIYICQFQWCKHQPASLEPPVWFHWLWTPEELGTVCTWGLTPTSSNPTVQVPLQIPNQMRLENHHLHVPRQHRHHLTQYYKWWSVYKIPSHEDINNVYLGMVPTTNKGVGISNFTVRNQWVY